MSHVLAVLLLGLAVLAPLPAVVLAPVALVAAGAVVALGIWSYRADPPIWAPPLLWSGRLG